MKKNIFVFIAIFSFLLLKLSNLGLRLSDTNIYWNVAYQMLQGKLLYRDIFFSNFPLFAYISSFYYLLSGKNIEFFYATSLIEVSLVTFLIYKIVYLKTKNHTTSLISSLLYIFSFIVLSTSDHQTGVFAASLFAVLGFYFFEKKLYVSGIFIALSFLTKAYFLPVALSFFGYLMLKKKWKSLLPFTLGFIITTAIVLLPSLLQSSKQFFSDIFGFSLTRPSGASKAEIAWFFIAKDFLFLVILLFNLLNFRKNIFFALLSLFSIVFFLDYKDVYYLYLNFLAPFLCLSFYEISYFLKSKFHLQKLIIPSLVSVFILLNIFVYIFFYRNLQKVNNANGIISLIKKEKPEFLYGVNDITPALIVITKIPALENINDAHDYFFIRGIYNKEALTQKAISTKTIVIAHGAVYPEFNIEQNILDTDILDKEEIYKHCQIILSQPVQAEGPANRINLFKCY